MLTISTNEKIENSNILGGIASWYGLRARPAGGGCIPKNHSAIFTHDEALSLFPAINDKNNVRHGVVCYPHTLDDSEVNSFELIPLNKDKSIEQAMANSIPDNEMQADYINMIAATLMQTPNEFLIEDLEYEGDVLIRDAFKNSNAFKERNTHPELFKAYKALFTSTHANPIIARVKALCDTKDAA